MGDGPFQLLPDLSGEDYERLREDIRERGIMVPIEVDETGVILDGHHRKRIAAELGIECPSITRIGLAEHEKRLHAVSLNLARRHLTDAQKVMLGIEIEPDIAEAARRRQAQASGAPRGVKATSASETFRTQTGRSVDEVARKVGLGTGRTYENHRKSLAEAETLAPQVIERAKAGEATMADVRSAVKEAQRDARVAEKREASVRLAQVAPKPAVGTYPVICADPPWRYEQAVTATRAIENHYPTMAVEDIVALPCPADDDAVLFLWATNPKLIEAMQVMQAWGFEYRTNIVWVKDRPGMGYYARGQHELLLIGRRGSFPVPDPEDRPSSVLEAPRQQHSQKPDSSYALIERMYPAHKKLEMFSRRPRAGWDVWGNQAAA
jgi:N6-adenosine-specific RNA methylase IME4